MFKNKELENMEDGKDLSSTTFKVLGIEFSGPTWMALIFLVFCLVVLIFFVPDKVTEQPTNIQTVQDPVKDLNEITIPTKSNQREVISDEHWQDEPLQFK